MSTRQLIFAIGMGVGALSALLMPTGHVRAASCDLETYLVWSGLGSPTVCDNHDELEAIRLVKEQQDSNPVDERDAEGSEATDVRVAETVYTTSNSERTLPVAIDEGISSARSAPVSVPAFEAALSERANGEDEGSSLEHSYFAKTFGGFGSLNARSGEPSSDVKMGGVVGGADLYSNDWLRLGVIGMYAQIQVEVNEDAETVDISSLKLGGQATIEWENWHLDGLFIYGPEITSAGRVIGVSGTDLKLTNDYTNHRVTQAFELGYTERIGSLVIQPSAGVELDWLYQSKATERGHDTAAIWTKRSAHWSGETSLGLTLSTVMIIGDIPVVPTLAASWHHRFGKLSNTMTQSFNSGLTYEKTGMAPARDVAELQASVGFNLKSNMVLNMGYTGRFDRFETLHAGSIGFRIDF